MKPATALFRSLAIATAVWSTPAIVLASTGSYGYVGTVEGSATLVSRGTTGNEPAGDRGQLVEINQPILTGDHLLVGQRGRVEFGLADRNLLRVDAGSDLIFEQLAASGDSAATSTLLRLDNGEIQLVVVDGSEGEEFPRIDTPNATVYTQSYGTFRVTTEAPDWTTLVVREGTAEVVTQRGSWTVRAGEELRVEGVDRPRASLVDASGWSALERWSQRLDAQVAAADSRHVDRSLRYAAAPLARHGSWFNTGGRYAWRPAQGLEWRPYENGRWVYTPSGLTWVSSEPWAWATYHYGGWDYVPGYGWSWFPGTTYAPAWVYWYWANDYVAWCPTAYYTRYYHGYDRFRWGTYGWAGGRWDGFDDWTFCPSRFFGRRDLRDYCLSGRNARQRWNLAEVPRGIITTDTRPLTPDRWYKPIDAINALERGAGGGGFNKPGAGGLPDVSDFVARRRDLTPQVVGTVAGKDPAAPAGGRGNRTDARWVDVNGDMEPRLPTNVLTPGNTSEDGKPIRDPRTGGMRIATPDYEENVPSRQPRTPRTDNGQPTTGGDWRTDSGKPTVGTGERTGGDKPATGTDWRTGRPNSGSATPTKPGHWDSAPAAPAPEAKPAKPSDQAPPAWRSSERAPRAPAPTANDDGNDSWRTNGGRYKPTAPVTTRRHETPAPDPSSGSDWRTATPLAPRSDRSPAPEVSHQPTPRVVEDDWRNRDASEAPPVSTPRMRVPSERGYSTPAPSPAPDPAESPAVRRIMDRIGVGLGHGSSSPRESVAPTPKPYTPAPHSAPTASPESRRSSPPAERRGGRSEGQNGGGSRDQGSEKDSEPPR